MLNDATCFKQVYIVTGYTDLRSGIDRLAALVRSHFGGNPIEPDTIYLFCGRRTDRIKGLVWENDGYLLLYKRLEAGKFQGTIRQQKRAIFKIPLHSLLSLTNKSIFR